MPGVVSPHELLQKLQLVQQEQSLASHDLPRLAARFLGPSHGQGAGSVVGPVPNQTTVAQKATQQFQVSTVNSVSCCLWLLYYLCSFKSSGCLICMLHDNSHYHSHVNVSIDNLLSNEVEARVSFFFLLL